MCYNDVMVKNQKKPNEAKSKPAAKAVDAVRPLQKKKSRTAAEAQPAAKRSWKERWKTWRERRLAKRGRHPMPALLRVPCAILLLAVVAIFLTWFMIWRTNLCDAEAAMEFIQEKPKLAYYDYLVVFSLLGLLAAVTWRPFLSTGIIFAGLSILSFIHIQKFQLRAEPLLPEEFAMADKAGNLMQFVDGDAVARLVWGVIFVIVGSALAEYYIRRFVSRSPKNLPWWDRSTLVPRTTCTMVALALLAGITNPILRRKDYDWLGDIDFRAWDQARNYRENGFIVGFIYNLGSNVVETPAEYSEAKMAEVAEKYETKKLADDASRLDWSDEVDNVIVVLAETFYDPALLTKYYDYYGGDVTPNLHEIFRKYPSGYMYSPEYGGGTANVEFEVQTGLTNYWARTYPYVNVVSKLDNLYGIANWSKKSGFDTTAVHSYDGAIYKRNIVYPKLGYDAFIDEDDMTHTEHEYWSGVINDQSIYNEVLDLLKNNDGKQMIMTVTMQNHAPYDQAGYPKYEFTQKTKRSESNDIEASFQSLHESDKYLAEFIEELDKLDERTVVLWFGDHAMGSLDQYVKSGERADYNTAHLTPYFIYANFEIENNAKLESNIDELVDIELGKKVRGLDLPTTSPNCLQNTMYNVLNLKKPAFFYLLDDVCTTNPILTNAYLDGKPPVQDEALADYELVNYDMLFGKHYWDGE